MAKTMIKGRFATPADAAVFYDISDDRRRHLDDEVEKAIAKVVDISPVATKSRKSSRSKQSGKTVGLRAKRK